MAQMMCRVIVMMMVLGGCTSSLHGTFAAHSFQGGSQQAFALGTVEGRSCQVQGLYLLPMDEPPSTQQALEAAKQVIPGTHYLVDISIDDETLWHFGYARQCIVVQATAWGMPQQ
ncbi:hypothetical protein [Ferrimonas futtsuensis]|uniref:hypothetical protein n=1 Tax=Ferrimonas futtsuensis TaxID=364764 RepID=UPI000428D700|nr:hypothetical protein [Ferrimonas futtsuensis]